MLYYILNYTWGILMTLIGWLVYLVLLPFARSRGKFFHAHYLVVGNNHWGGVSIGVCFFICADYVELKQHEYGHTFQNAYYGLAMPFIVSIPSAIRYWYYSICIKHGKTFPPNWYDSIWFEKQATLWGRTKF